ncbi:embryonic protein UVS.2-like [Saccostrea cucullata]|uniref:embryonic protein UVS.2-like n=1 Tax=Saccostrea cuccullata TaxID=36930 RepID=UPI002ED17D20
MCFLVILLIISIPDDCVMASVKFSEIRDTNKCQITSPGYPDHYPNNANFTWIIRAGRNESIFTFVIDDMDIEIFNSGFCDDYLEIKEIEPCCYTAFKECGKITERTVHTKGKEIEISFISDSTRSAKGFNLSWTGTCNIVSKKSPHIKPKTTSRIYPSSKTTNLTNTPGRYTTTAPSTKLTITSSTITPSLRTTIASSPSSTSPIVQRKTTYTQVKPMTTLLTTHLATMSKSETHMLTGMNLKILN